MAQVRLSEYGVTFATRQRADALATQFPRDTAIELDFAGVKAASPSFIDELFGLLSTMARTVEIYGVAPELEDLVERVIRRRELGARFKMTATA